MEKHSLLEKDFLKEKEQEAISFQDRYKELQVNWVYLKFNLWTFGEACNITSEMLNKYIMNEGSDT